MHTTNNSAANKIEPKSSKLTDKSPNIATKLLLPLAKWIGKRARLRRFNRIKKARLLAFKKSQKTGKKYFIFEYPKRNKFRPFTKNEFKLMLTEGRIEAGEKVLKRKDFRNLKPYAIKLQAKNGN